MAVTHDTMMIFQGNLDGVGEVGSTSGDETGGEGKSRL
jgi:hypothetical protein